MNSKTIFSILVILILSVFFMPGQGQTDQSIASATTTIQDYDITVNSDQNGNYVIGLRAEKEDCYVYFDDIKNDDILVGTAQKTSPPASTAPTADYLTHEAGPEWGTYTVSKLPSKVSITSIEGGFERSKDLIKYIPYSFNNYYYVNDSIIKDEEGNEIGLKIKMQYPKNLKAYEKGVLEVEVITKDFGNASQPDWQNNILSFCILKILSDENLSEEDEFVAGFADKGMSVTPVTIGIAAKPLYPINYWIRYDDSLYQTIKRDHPEFVVTDEVIDATTALIGEVPIMSTTTPGEKTGGGILFTFADLLFTPLTGLDFDELLMAFAKWQVVYTVGNAPSDEFSDENHFDCWTYIFGFNVNENLCTGANGVRLNFPFSFDNEGEHEIKIHLDTMFEGEIPSLGVKGGRIGKEYTLSLPSSSEQSRPEEKEVIFPDPNLEAAIREAINKPDGAIFAPDLEELTILSVENSEIKDITGLEYCTNLQNLSLYSNQITDISPLSGLTNLQMLFLDINQITDISPLSGLTNLQMLRLGSNQIKDISPLSGLTNLLRLELYSNQITDISPLSGLTNLQTLYLDSNQITDVSRLSGLTNLQELHLDSNQITDVSRLSGLTNLQWLYLDSNQIKDISRLSGLTNLQWLYLDSNQIKDISRLSGLTNLLRLSLGSNQITDVSPLSGLTNLLRLSLDSNQITDISPLSGLTNLQSLSLVSNQITDISPLSGLTNLQWLYLDSNQITDISPLSGLTNLLRLGLYSNQITDFSPLSGLTCEVTK
jgi:Leucine-rich repeat (LRR) protein